MFFAEIGEQTGEINFYKNKKGTTKCRNRTKKKKSKHNRRR